MKFHTEISQMKEGETSLRGIPLRKLMQDNNFLDVVFLLLRGTFPSAQERSLLDIVLISSVEHGIAPPSIFVPRITVSVGNPMHVALAAGILATGESHGGAGTQAAELFIQPTTPQAIVAEAVVQHRMLPGFGHQFYHDEDPRATIIFRHAQDLGFDLHFFDRAYAIEKELSLQKNRNIPLNVDGAIAAALLTLGFDQELGHFFFLLGRVVGIAAHVQEEKRQQNRYYRLEETDIVR